MAEYPPEIMALIEAAKAMPRQIPKSGGCGTIHSFKIEAAVVWKLDKALRAIERMAK